MARGQVRANMGSPDHPLPMTTLPPSSIPVQGRLTLLRGDALAALVVGLSAISSYLSMAALIFQGPLAVHLQAGIGAALMGGAVLALFGAWRGALPLASAGPVPTSVSLMAAMSASIAAQASPGGLLPTTVAALAAAGLLVGGIWWLMGRRGWGGVALYIPYPVVGGFLAATGWMMLAGGLGVAMGQSFTWARLGAWVMGGGDARLAVGVAVGVVIWFATQRSKHPLMLPVLLVLCIAGTRAGLAAAGLDVPAARAAGWLMAPFGSALPAWPLSPEMLGRVEWGLVAQQAGLLASIVAVATLSLLLTNTSLEVAWDTRVDINRDLRAMGQGNLLTLVAGGLMGAQSPSRSLLNRTAGARTRWASAMLGVLCLLAMGWGGPLLALVPTPVLGGLLVWQGLGVMKTWLLDSRKRLQLADHLTIVAMVAITAVLGFLPAVCLGVLACCVGFAVSSSRLTPVRRLLPRSAWPAKAERNAAQAALLAREGERLMIAELQGVIFFGSATQLSQYVEPLCDTCEKPQVLLLDFRHVRGLDVSAAQALSRVVATARRQGVDVAFSGLSPELKHVLAAGGLLGPKGPRVHDCIDTAVTAWDDAVLARHAGPAVALEAAIASLLPPGTPVGRLLAHFEPVRLADGERLFSQGEPSQALFLVRAGRVAIVGEDEQGQEVLLRTVHEGSVIGEMGLLRGTPRSAGARAQGAVELLVLSHERLDHLLQVAPELAASLFRLFVMQMAGRVEQLGVQAHALKH